MDAVSRLWSNLTSIRMSSGLVEHHWESATVALARHLAWLASDGGKQHAARVCRSQRSHILPPSPSQLSHSIWRMSHFPFLLPSDLLLKQNLSVMDPSIELWLCQRRSLTQYSLASSATLLAVNAQKGSVETLGSWARCTVVMVMWH